MVTLLCFCCDHGNPAGAKFCNACGTPLHLKPCKRCEAINTRAAAHCHQCGETFALEFLSLDEAMPLLPAPDAVEVAAPAVAAGEAARGRPRAVFTRRVVAVLLGLTTTALLSAYFAYQQPGIGLAAGLGEPLRPVSAVTADSRPEALPAVQAQAPTEVEMQAAAQVQVVAPPAGAPGGSLGAIQPIAGAQANGATPRGAVAPSTASARKGSAPKTGAKPSAASSKPLPARNAARATQAEPVAPPVVVRHAEPPQADPGPIALQQAVAIPPSRPAVADSAPPRRALDTPKRPPPAPAAGRWDRPCAEGVALGSDCDVRMMPKGN